MVVILIAGGFFTWWTIKKTDREMRQNRLAHARLAAEAINVERVKALSGTEADLGSDHYLRLKQQFASVRAADPRCRFVYLMGRNEDGSVFFFADSEPAGSEDESPAGQIYDEVSDEYLAAFNTVTALVEGPVTDRWGTWVSALVPLIDPETGALIAMLGTDVDARYWHRAVAAKAALPAGLFALAGLIAFFYIRLRHSDALLREHQAALNLERDQYQSLVGNIPGATYRCAADDDWSIFFISNQIEQITGYPASDYVRNAVRTYESIIHEEDTVAVRRDVGEAIAEAKPYEIEYRVYHRDGSIHWVYEKGRCVYTPDGEVEYLDGFILDVTERKLAEEQLAVAATTDKLTGLPNRALFMDRLDRRLKQSKRDGSNFAVLFFDFDRFKIVNDSLGHDVGDALLCSIANIFERELRESDTVARFGGDEFVVLLSALANDEDAEIKSKRLLEVFAEPHEINGHHIVSTASIGLVTNALSNESGAEMIRDADVAMYQAKANGKSQVVTFDFDMLKKAVDRQELEADMRDAIHNEQFLLLYQPIIDLSTGQVDGFESLVRWDHPVRGMIGPEFFIPIAEETGLIIELGGWVAREAARQISAWNQKRPDSERLFVNINLSKRELLDVNICESLVECRQEFHLRPKDLRLEITETTIADVRSEVLPMLNKLRDHGFSISIDDFGTGLSSLGALHNYPIDCLKIDKSFILRLDSDRSLFAVVSAITSMTQSLGIPVVAEGIESKDTVIALESIGCRWGQGYHFAEPLPASRVDKYLLDNNKRRTSAA
ncbi:MAG: EAL domain-containing protein [Planctomycetota bacterium]